MLRPSKVCDEAGYLICVEQRGLAIGARTYRAYYASFVRANVSMITSSIIDSEPVARDDVVLACEVISAYDHAFSSMQQLRPSY